MTSELTNLPSIEFIPCFRVSLLEIGELVKITNIDSLNENYDFCIILEITSSRFKTKNKPNTILDTFKVLCGNKIITYDFNIINLGFVEKISYNK